MKILEVFLLPTFAQYLSLADNQQGFRKVHSALNAKKIGLNKKPRGEIFVALDLTKAFGTVNLTTLPDDIENLHFLQGWRDGWWIMWLNREFRRAVSSPHFFLTFIFRNPQLPDRSSVTSYVDVYTIMKMATGIYAIFFF